MHRIVTTPGGWNADTEGVIIVEQTPASIIILTCADTDIQTLAAAVPHLPSLFPTVRVVNLLHLQQQLSIDSYAETVLSHADVIIVRLLGGRAYWPYGLEVIQELAEHKGPILFILPGDERPDLDLITHSTASLKAVDQLWHYLTHGGVENWVNALKFVADTCFHTHYNPLPPQEVPRMGLYVLGSSEFGVRSSECCYAVLRSGVRSSEGCFSVVPRARVGILFYRAHYLAGNTQPIDALCHALEDRGLLPIPVFVSSLRDKDIQEDLLSYFIPSDAPSIQVLLNTTSFAINSLDKPGNISPFSLSETEEVDLWQTLNIPVLQVILSSGTLEQWQSSFAGLTPRDVAMNVALPEVDGRIITRAISFKSVATWNNTLETNVVIYQPQIDRVNFVADLAAHWVRLKQTPIPHRKMALILANYPNRDGRLANGVGLDTPASCIEILYALKSAGYRVDNIPENGDDLIKLLTQGITNDPEGQGIRPVYQYLPLEEYQNYFATLPPQVQAAVNTRWGNYPLEDKIPISGIQLGNVFIGIQPSRGYDLDPSLNYHAPDLDPTPQYLAYYYWLTTHFQALAVVHLGKHGNLEWLPGKSLALSQSCYPEIALATLPHFYPFIVNDPGEGSQAKRRTHAVIIDHLTPPLTRAELYGDLLQLETLIDEYYEAQSLDPSRVKVISDRILSLLQKTHLNQDLGIPSLAYPSLSQFLTLADGYLCELKEAQIRDGLHIFGKCPQHQQLRDLILSIARSPSLNRIGFTQALARDLNLDFDPLMGNRDLKVKSSSLRCGAIAQKSKVKGQGMGNKQEEIFPPSQGGLGGISSLQEKINTCRHWGDVITTLELYALSLIENLLENGQDAYATENRQDAYATGMIETDKQLHWIKSILLPALKNTPQEITYLLKGLNGEYVPAAPSGAPTRGRPEVLPTGKNFYSVDIRAIPTQTAWDIGRKAAETLIEKYTQDNGEYPRTLAISIWGTSTMRTGGDDIAQVLALLGVQPVWDTSSRRVIDYEILTPSALGRPRVDVTLRISGFFRDSFPILVNLLYHIINDVSSLNEEKEINPLAAQVKAEQGFWENQGLTEKEARQKAGYRIFGSKPGAYGAGLQGLIEAQNWETDEDLARAYINWSCYSYDGEGIGHNVPEVFQERLKQLQIILHNQDNREHDLLDSDDYYQFQGGLTASVRALTGKNPQTYFGDNSNPANPKVRLLKEEIARVYRSRVINPKWIEGVMRHGYKGAFEIAATVDYLFAYDATARCVEDFMYQGVAQAYLFDEKVRGFIEDKNPWALRDIAERLIEAHQRGLWEKVEGETLEQLRAIVHQAEGVIEIHNS